MLELNLFVRSEQTMQSPDLCNHQGDVLASIRNKVPIVHGPAGQVDADGRFRFITTRTDAPKYASNDPSRPSAEEAMAIASGSIAYTGTYTIDESTRTINANVETSTFPNLVGAPTQRRIVTSITADDMKFTNPRNPAGVTLEFVWKRAK